MNHPSVLGGQERETSEGTSKDQGQGVPDLDCGGTRWTWGAGELRGAGLVEFFFRQIRCMLGSIVLCLSANMKAWDGTEIGDAAVKPPPCNKWLAPRCLLVAAAVPGVPS